MKDSSQPYLKLKEKSLYLTVFSCPFGRYQYTQLPFRAASVGDMFQKKIDVLFSGIANVFCIADDILVAGFDEWNKDHDESLANVLQVCK